MEEIAGITADYSKKLGEFNRHLKSLPNTIRGKRKLNLQLNLIRPVLDRLPTDIMDVHRELEVQRSVEEADRMEAATPELERQLNANALARHQAELQEIADQRRGEVVLPVRFGGRRSRRRSVHRRRRTSRR
jgi:hypothetical protein